LKTAAFDSTHTTSYQSVLCCTIFKIFDVEEYRDLEIEVRGHSPCEFMHDLYIVVINRPGAIFCYRQYGSISINLLCSQRTLENAAL